MIDTKWTRRRIINAAGLGACAWLMGWAVPGQSATKHAGGVSPKKQSEKNKEEISPNEDLMREHGVLDRILLIYEEGLRRVDAQEDLALDAIAGSAAIVRRFIEDYHEKLEEDFLFPRFEKAGRLRDLVSTLRTQHQAGRRLTDSIQKLSSAAAVKDATTRKQLSDALGAFIRMYRPHAAREDTVLFPAFHAVVSRHEYAALGEQFEDKEHDLFGADGFEKILHQVAGIETQLGIEDLNRFTPA